MAVENPVLLNRIKRALKTGLILILYLLGSLYRSKGIPVLLYHSIDDSGSLLSISPNLFRKQMTYLKKRGYQTISLDSLCDILDSDQPLPSNTVIITFDDGYRNLHTAALPILAEHGYTATVFLVTGCVGGQIDWVKTSDVPALSMATWDQIREMADAALEIQAHSVTHPNFLRITVDQAIREIQTSRADIESRLGKKVAFFAYPYGEFNDQIKAMLKTHGYRGAVTGIFGKTLPQGERYALKRLNVTAISAVSDFTRMLFFKCCLTGTAEWYVALRSLFPSLVHVDRPWDDEQATFADDHRQVSR